MSLIPFLILLFQLTSTANCRCVTTRHVSGYGNRGGGFIGNDLDEHFYYLNNERCGWEIAVPPGSTIAFHFIKVDMEVQENKCFDYVSIFDGPNKESALLTKRCVGNDEIYLKHFHTSQQFAFVYFFSDSSRQGRGFKLRWYRLAPKPPPSIFNAKDIDEYEPVSACKDTRLLSALGSNGFGGYLTNDKNWESLYFNNENCGWLITVPPGSTIRLYFTKIDMETSENPESGSDTCEHDWVSIYDGLRPENISLIARQCSSTGVFQDLFTKQQYAFIEFHTDSSVQYEGFELRWLRHDESPKLPPSLEISEDHQVRVQSAQSAESSGVIVNDIGLDGMYLDNEASSWRIEVPEGLTIRLDFVEIEMEGSISGQCFDWVAIYDGEDENSTLLTKQCFSPAVRLHFDTTSNFAFVHFHSDQSQHYKGFKLAWAVKDNSKKRDPNIEPAMELESHSWQTVCKQVNEIRGNETVRTGYVLSPRDDSDGLYPNNVQCNWRIVVPDGCLIRLSFSKLDMDEHELCWHDWVSIYNGESNHAPILTKQCSNKAVGKFFTSSGNQAYVRFRSDSSGQKSGFKLLWSTTGCLQQKPIALKKKRLTTVLSTTSFDITSTTTAGTTTTGTTTTGTTTAGTTTTGTTTAGTTTTGTTTTTTMVSTEAVNATTRGVRNESIAEVIKEDLENVTTLAMILADDSTTASWMTKPILITGMIIIVIVGLVLLCSFGVFVSLHHHEKKSAVFYLDHNFHMASPVNQMAECEKMRNNDAVYRNLGAHVTETWNHMAGKSKLKSNPV